MIRVKLIPRIKVKLAEHNMKQIELADKLGLNKQTISNICNGKTLPSIDKLFSMAYIFNCSTDDLYKYEVIEEPE